MSTERPAYKRRKRRTTATNWERDRCLAHLSWTTKGIHVYYSYRSMQPNRVFHHQFDNIAQYTMWWAAFHDQVKVRRETWPRRWTRTAAYQLNENALGAKITR